MNAWPFHRGEHSLGVKLLAVASWGALALMLAIALTMWALGDRAALGTMLLFAGRWIYLPPLLALALLARRLRRALLVPLGAALGVVLFPIMGLTIGWRRVLPAPEGTPIRVVTLNTGNNARIAGELPGLLEEWRADVVALQECASVMEPAVRALRGWHVHVASPTCLVSRYPIQVAQEMDRSAFERVRSDAVLAIGGAGYVVRYVLATPAGPVGFTNLHLETARKGLESFLTGDFNFRRLAENSELRDIEGERARQWVNDGMVPTIVAGDFNTPRESRNFREHWGDLTNAYSVAGLGFGATKFNGWIRLRIDHVLYGQGLRAVRAFVAPDVWSDHRPLVVDLVRLDRVGR